ncbi:hypothetical protein DFH07DRAFT_776672 [Mycena maculata]|uniref:Uncharacterized protein n=1 Tax=Mycena maculata TaxID=230809 RepID=A0AAD7N4U0_9AGAR|nr:hypothetical protein DFH07DRAFT_776672 [Mycena maculata]
MYNIIRFPAYKQIRVGRKVTRDGTDQGRSLYKRKDLPGRPPAINTSLNIADSGVWRMRCIWTEGRFGEDGARQQAVDAGGMMSVWVHEIDRRWVKVTRGAGVAKSGPVKPGESAWAPMSSIFKKADVWTSMHDSAKEVKMVGDADDIISPDIDLLGGEQEKFLCVSALIPTLVLSLTSPPDRALQRHPVILSRGNSNSECNPSCDPCEAFLQNVTDIDVLCTNAVASQCDVCFNCEVTIGVATQAQAQSAANSFVSQCAAAGVPVNNLTIISGAEHSVPAVQGPDFFTVALTVLFLAAVLPVPSNLEAVYLFGDTGKEAPTRDADPHVNHGIHTSKRKANSSEFHKKWRDLGTPWLFSLWSTIRYTTFQ